MASIAYAYCSPSPPMRYPHASGDDNAVEIGGYERPIARSFGLRTT